MAAACTAVRDVGFAVAPGEVVSLIGESGSGKSTIGRMILRLIAVNGGRITYDGTDIVDAHVAAALRAYYRERPGRLPGSVQLVQPDLQGRPRLRHRARHVSPAVGAGGTWDERVDEALASVGLEAGQLLHKYPHQLSGGQLQRLLIARALLLDTQVLVADEIISMLDASTRIDVLNLLGDLKARGLGILFITHDLSLANYISERTVILRRGRVVEIGPTDRVFEQPAPSVHPAAACRRAAAPREVGLRAGCRPRGELPIPHRARDPRRCRRVRHDRDRAGPPGRLRKRGRPLPRRRRRPTGRGRLGWSPDGGHPLVAVLVHRLERVRVGPA